MSSIIQFEEPSDSESWQQLGSEPDSGAAGGIERYSLAASACFASSRAAGAGECFGYCLYWLVRTD